VNARDPRDKTTLGAAAAPRAKTCTIFAKSAGTAQYGWGSEASDKSRRSKGLFRYFYECVQDARKHGYAVEYDEVAQSLRAGRPDHVPPATS
jgi:hypothetical protein